MNRNKRLARLEGARCRNDGEADRKADEAFAHILQLIEAIDLSAVPVASRAEYLRAALFEDDETARHFLGSDAFVERAK